MAGGVLWLTGLSGAGKTTIARALAEALRGRGAAVEVLDGDELRQIAKTGFSRDERNAHVRRVGDFAARLERHGIFAIVAMVSPYRESRVAARSFCKSFFEIWVSTPLAACEARDPKGLYRRARSRELTSLTGVDDPYEPPLAPELTLDASRCPVAQAVESILRSFHPKSADARTRPS